jgi:hypothetical protein
MDTTLVVYNIHQHNFIWHHMILILHTSTISKLSTIEILNRSYGQVYMSLHILSILSSVSDVFFIYRLLLERMLPKVLMWTT